VLWHDELALVSCAPIREYLHDLGNHVASALHDDNIANPNVLAANLILVVERGPADHDAPDVDWLQ
jgi:hypothetical protein